MRVTRQIFSLFALSSLSLALLAPVWGQSVQVADDIGQQVRLNKPAQRVISLAPHVTELLFAAGGGKQLVGVVAYSDFPPEAKQITQVGDNRQWDLERIIALKPDLLVVWQHGNSEHQINALRKLGVPMYYSEPKKLDDIAASIERLGTLLGTPKQAQENARNYRQQMHNLRQQYAGRSTVRVFYQVWDKPLYTLNGKHIVSDVLAMCGGENIFASLDVLAPNVSAEAVVKEDPEVIISGDQNEQGSNGLRLWRAWPGMRAVKNGNLFAVDGELLGRSGPRMAQGAAILCEKLELVRQKRTAKVR